jgi:cation transport regulator
MPYQSIDSLPASVRAELPTEGQRLYRNAFNSAWQIYADFTDREPFCHRIARLAVRRSYRKGQDGIWHPIRDGVAEATIVRRSSHLGG